MAKHTTTPVWPVLTIAECASAEPYSTQIGPFGKALTPEAYKPSGVPLLRGVNVNRGRFHDDDYVFISEADADRLSKFESFPGDVLLVHKGSLGQIGLMPERRRFDRYIMGNSMMRVRCERSKLLPEYLRYWLQSSDGQSYLLGRVSQVGVPQLQRPLTTLREAALPVPPVAMQQHVVDVLGCLEDKIEQNRRAGRKLEALARATFKAWFVDFEPVKAKAAGATAFPGMPAETFVTLPSRIVDSELGPVPDRWEVTRWGNVATLEYGKSLRGYQNGGGPYRVFGTNGPIGWHNERLADGPGIIIGRKGAYRGVHYSPHPFWAIDTAFFVKSKRRIDLKWAYYELLRADINSMDSGSAIPSTSRDDLYAIPVCVPSESVLQAFDSMTAPMFEFRVAMQAEDAKLAALRDYLLPRLLSGRVRVAAGNGRGS